ncbi:MAG: hypothetical protein ACM3NQ_10150 [Bacteroidales bacterium]
MKRAVLFLAVVAVVAAFGVGGDARQNPRGLIYETFDVPGADATNVSVINDAGDIAGSYSLDGKEHGFLLRQGQLQTIDGPEPTTFSTLIHGISASGEVVGQYRYAGTCPDCPPWVSTLIIRGFAWKAGVLDVIHVPGASYTISGSVNAGGAIVGEYWAGGRCLGFYYKDGAFSTVDMAEDPADPMSWSAAYGLNAQGDVAGWYGNGATFIMHGYVLSKGRKTTIDVPGFTWVTAGAINDQREVIVNAYENWAVKANYIWKDGSLVTEIRVPGAACAACTVAYGINNRGDVVGQYWTADYKGHGFIAHR